MKKIAIVTLTTALTLGLATSTAAALGSIAGSLTCPSAAGPGVTINLYDCPGQSLLASCVTDGVGAYLFPDLDPGDYTVEAVSPPGCRAAEGSQLTVSVTVSSDEPVTVDFAVEWQSSAYYEDADGDGICRAGETITFYADTHHVDDSCQLHPLDQWYWDFDSDGVITGSGQTNHTEYPEPGAYIATIYNWLGSSYMLVELPIEILPALPALPASISGTVASAGDPFAGVTVRLFDSPDPGHVLLESAVTDALGICGFIELGPEEYTVEATPPPGYQAAAGSQLQVTVTVLPDEQETVDFELEWRSSAHYDDEDEDGVCEVSEIITFVGDDGYIATNGIWSPMTQWDWDFDSDGHTDASGQTVTRSWTGEGTYTVTLRELGGELKVVELPIEIVPPPFASVAGTVTCGGDPVPGVTVDLSGPQAFASRLTNARGAFDFGVDAAGDYTVDLVVPLGYRAVGPKWLVVSVTEGDAETADFLLERLATASNARSAGYWKHQYKVHDSGPGHGQAHESATDLAGYRASVLEHFYNRGDEYAIRISGVTHTAGGALTDEHALATLSVRGSALMNEKAYRQLLALLLNVVSGKVATYLEVTEDGLTVSCVITHAADLLEDANPANDEQAKDLAEMVNAGERIPADVLPPDTPNIAYRRIEEPRVGALSCVQPNPTRGHVRISYDVPPTGAAISLRVYDPEGRLLRTLVQCPQAGGRQHVNWMGDDDLGQRLAGGVYFYRIQVGDRSESRRIILW